FACDLARIRRGFLRHTGVTPSLAVSLDSRPGCVCRAIGSVACLLSRRTGPGKGLDSRFPARTVDWPAAIMKAEPSDWSENYESRGTGSMKRFLAPGAVFLLAALAGQPSDARAHFVFLVPSERDAAKNSLQMVFSDNLKPDPNPKLLEKITQTELF